MRKNIFNSNSSVYLIYDYLTFPINLNIISKIKIGSETFFPKNSYHVSLLHLGGLSNLDQNKILNFAKKYPIKLKSLTKVYRLAKQEDKRSIIVRVKLSGLKKLISSINKHLNYKFHYPPTHITLFNLKGQYGIGINSQKEYKEITEHLDPKSINKLSKCFRLI